MIGTQFDAEMKILRTNNRTEYVDSRSFAYLESNGTVQQTSCPYISTQNEVAKRKIGHLLEVARSFLFTMNLPKTYWRDVVLVFAYLVNRMPLKTLDFRSSLEVLQRKKYLHYSTKMIWVCLFYPY